MQRTAWAVRSAVLLGLAAVLASLTLSACVEPLSPADLERDEAHAYAGRSKAEVHRATVTALRTLGYEVVVDDEASGKIKTSPKLVTAVAQGGSYGAVATENAIAWSIDVVASASDGAALHAEPRGYSGGQAVPPSQMNGPYLDGMFKTLYDEIDSNLVAKK